MPALNFRKQFADDVECGIKRQSVRAPRKDGRDPKKGDKLVLYTGMRTKSCRKLGEAVVTSVHDVEIRATDMAIDGRTLYTGNRDSLGEHKDPDQFDGDFAQADGFDDYMDMSDWFADTHGLPFEGKLIRWSEPR